MKKMNVGLAALFIAVSLYVLFAVQSFPKAVDGVPGPGFFPAVLSVVILFLSFLLLLSSRKVSTASLNVFCKENSRVFIAGGLTAGYIALIYIGGFLIATPLYLISIMRFFGMKSWLSAVMAAVLTTAATFVVFGTVLAVQLPGGMFF